MNNYWKGKITRALADIAEQKEKLKRKEKRLDEEKQRFDKWIGERISELIIKLTLLVTGILIFIKLLFGRW